jgi:hypothetical protein
MKIILQEQRLENLAYMLVVDKLSEMDFKYKKYKEFSFFPKGTHDAYNGVEADWAIGQGYHILIGHALFRSVRDLLGLTDEQTKDAFRKAFVSKGLKKIADIESIDFGDINIDYYIDDEDNQLQEYVIKEQYNKENLYPKSDILNLLKGAPKELKGIIKTLPDIPCENHTGHKTICTRIPESIWVYLTGRY